MSDLKKLFKEMFSTNKKNDCCNMEIVSKEDSSTNQNNNCCGTNPSQENTDNKDKKK